MIYYKIEKEDNNENHIYLVEDKLDYRYNLKTESVFAQSNGYLGIRASHEAKMLHQSRGMFVSGLYHAAGEHEVPELVNCPDIIGMIIEINGEEYSLDRCRIKYYQRRLNLMTGQLVTKVECDLENTKGINIEISRFVSRNDRHMVCHETLLSLEEEADVRIDTGINGSITNSGVSHFNKVDGQLYDNQYMLLRSACDDDQLLHTMTVCSSNKNTCSKPVFYLKRRSIYGSYSFHLNAGERLKFYKYSYVDSGTSENITDPLIMVDKLKANIEQGYDGLYNEHQEAIGRFIQYSGIMIEGASLEEEAAIAFAQYHLLGMTPAHTSDYSVAAKGLTGEGYKGHVFWDTEIFIMPFFTNFFPDIAKNLLKFRYKGLKGAKDKASDNGFEGAMYPWEVADDGREVTPKFAALNIHTGVAERVWSGVKEQHITADVIYALWDYIKLTKDEEFLRDYGYEMLIETALFWCSRAEYIPGKDRYELLDVIGPDEYSEHVNNNAYTNYMAKFNVELALNLITDLKANNPKIYKELNHIYNLEQRIEEWKDFVLKIYVPQPSSDGIIPQDDTFLSKEKLQAVDKYRESDIKQSILRDFSRSEINNMQVLKQADVVMLFIMKPELFASDIREKNIRYYEQNTVHDSSLSHCVHCIAYAQIGAMKDALGFFRKAMEVDIDTNYKDSTDGIHAAALGGIMNCVLQGFAGIRYHMDYVELNPHLPSHWKELKFNIMVEGQYVQISISKEKISLHLENRMEKPLRFKVKGSIYYLEKHMEIGIL